MTRPSRTILAAAAFAACVATASPATAQQSSTEGDAIPPNAAALKNSFAVKDRRNIGVAFGDALHGGFTSRVQAWWEFVIGVAAELEYVDVQDYKGVDARGINLSLLPMIPLRDHRIFGKFGGTYLPSSSEDIDGFDVVFGTGVMIGIPNTAFGLRAEWTRQSMTDSLDAFTAGGYVRW
ncbi:MAG TPA: hypothetical protein VEC57_18750 [Candidatus Limnocylindrales bacterium]|nr:hypothetical protein [Candidatus Limnocylindrales bacterium]